MKTTQSEPAPSTTGATPFDDGELYDLIYDQIDYDLAYYRGLALAAGGPVLDIGCGTGRVLLPCLRAGVEMDGLDFFPGMLMRLRQKASALGLNPQLHEANMAGFHLPRRYALILIPQNAFVHNLTTDEQLATLRSCREHLLPGGRLVFDTAFPGPAWINAPSGTREMEIKVRHPETGLPVRQWDTRTFDRVQQLQYSYNEIELLDAQGKVVTTYPSKTTVRWIYMNEMELLLRLSGYAKWEILGGFDGRPLSQETDAMIVHAWALAP